VKPVVIFGMLVLMNGCASFQTQNYSPPVWTELNDEYLDTFISKDISEAQKIFGYKFTINPLGDGRTAYLWKMNDQISYAQAWSGPSKTIPCNWSFVTDSNGKIIDNQRFGYCNATLQLH